MMLSNKTRMNADLKMVAALAGIFSLIAMYQPAFAAAPGTFEHACDQVSGFFINFETILKVASISIVTIAIVFAGYQISFAHKRLSDVAPILIGGLLIGGSSALAGWFMSGWTSTNECGDDATTTSFLQFTDFVMAALA